MALRLYVQGFHALHVVVCSQAPTARNGLLGVELSSDRKRTRSFIYQLNETLDCGLFRPNEERVLIDPFKLVLDCMGGLLTICPPVKMGHSSSVANIPSDVVELHVADPDTAVTCTQDIHTVEDQTSAVPVHYPDDNCFSIIEVVGDIDRGWSITNHELGLPPLLLELLIQPEECTASGKGARPPAESSNPVADAVLFTGNAPRVFSKHRRRDEVGRKPAEQRANNDVEPKNEFVLPHAASHSMGTNDLARAA